MGSLDKYLQFLPYFIASAIATLLFTPWVIMLLKKLGMVQYPPDEVLEKLRLNKDDPNLRHKIIAAKRRQLKPPTAVGGGISYIIVFFVFSIVSLFLSKTINVSSYDLSSYLLWLAGLLVLFIGGILDDKFEHNGKQQFIFHVIGALLFVLSGFDLPGLHLPVIGYLNLAWTKFFLSWGSFHISFLFPSDVLLFIWIIVLILAIKMQAGTDSLMEGNTAIASLFIFAVSVQFGQFVPALFSIILAGALLGYSVYNFYPAFVFSGSAGEVTVGYLIATLSVMTHAKFGVTLIVFSIPLVDMLYVIIKRIFYYKLYTSPKKMLELFSLSDRFHLHHRLLKLGLSEPQIAILEYLVTMLIGLGCLLFAQKDKYLFVAIVWILMALAIIVINKLADKKHLDEVRTKR